MIFEFKKMFLKASCEALNLLSQRAALEKSFFMHCKGFHLIGLTQRRNKIKILKRKK